jgi:hypothetical protein
MSLPLQNLAFLLVAACALPAFAQEAKPAAPEEKTVTTGKNECQDCKDYKAGRTHWHHHYCQSDFAWQVQADFPTKDLGRALDNRVGLGLGMQWSHYRSAGVAHRTRLEWNVFPEGNAVGPDAVKTKASNYVLSFDRLYHFSGENQGFYILGGLGGVRWFLDHTEGANPTQSSHTTKLAITAGAGYRFNRAVSAEARYLVSSVDRTFDGNVLQGSVSMRF